MATELTREDFQREVRNFFEMCGTVEFWAQPEEVRNNVATGFAHVYCNAAELTDQDCKHFEMAIDNYSRRTIIHILYLGGSEEL